MTANECSLIKILKSSIFLFDNLIIAVIFKYTFSLKLGWAKKDTKRRKLYRKKLMTLYLSLIITNRNFSGKNHGLNRKIISSKNLWRSMGRKDGPL